MLAPTYSPLASTIGSRGLNCRVRKENGCDPSDKAPTQNIQRISVRLTRSVCTNTLSGTHIAHEERTRISIQTDSVTRLSQFLSRVLSGN